MAVRGLVLSVEKNRVTVLLPGGVFKQVKWHGPSVQVGHEIDLPAQSKVRYGWVAVPVLAVAGLFYFGALRPQAVDASAIISVDINPSVNLSVSAQGRVLSGLGLDRSGRRLLRQVSVDGRSASQAVDLLVRQAGRDGYLKRSHTVVIGAVFAENKPEWFKAVTPSAEAVLKSAHDAASLVTVTGVSPTMVQAMKASSQVSAGRYLLWRRHSRQTRDRLTVQDVESMPVSKLLRTLSSASGHASVPPSPPVKPSNATPPTPSLPNWVISVPTMVTTPPPLPATPGTSHAQPSHAVQPSGHHHGKGSGSGGILPTPSVQPPSVAPPSASGPPSFSPGPSNRRGGRPKPSHSTPPGSGVGPGSPGHSQGSPSPGSGNLNSGIPSGLPHLVLNLPNNLGGGGRKAGI